MDVEGDGATGKRTTSVVIGKRASAITAVVLGVLAVVWSLVVVARLYGDVTGLMLTTPSLGMLAWGAVRPGERGSSLTVQLVSVFVAFAAAVAWPMYLLLVVPLILASRYYYKSRFGLNFPGVQDSV